MLHSLATLALAQLGRIPAAASGASGSIDPVAATQAYLATVPAAERAASDAYFEGGYWLLLIDFVVASAALLLFLQTGISRRVRDWAERRTRFAALQTLLYWLAFLVATYVIEFPLTVYENFFREHSYHLSNQSFGEWFAEQLASLAVAAVLGGLAVVVLYAVVRKVGKSWWLWGTGVALVFVAFAMLIAPVAIEPIFNNYKPLDDPQLVRPILSLAHANGIDANEVFEFDASKQSKRISANVAGLGGTTRIALNDNLLQRASREEIEDVMGHEMGHYVLHHMYKGLLAFGLVIALGFAVVRSSFERLRGRWGIRGIGDVAGLPLVALLFGAYFFVMTPVTNTITRTMELEADIFGLNAARQPDGHAQVALKLAEYRKLDPGPIEEVVFFDHPSGRARIFAAMRWKADHPEVWKQ